jgi:carbon storage regulator
MLVLSRKCEQSVVIGDNIVVTVLGVDGDRVKLGIRAPREVAVLRKELYQQVQSANTAAATTGVVPTSLQSIAAALLGRGPHPETSPS